MLYWFLERKETGRERKKTKQKQNIHAREKINWLPPLSTLMGDQICNPEMYPNQNLLVYGTMLQPTEPPKPYIFFYY